MKKIALVTGANRGLGYQTSLDLAKKGIHVVMASRNPEKGKAAAEKLEKQGLDVEFHELDVLNPETIDRIYDYIEKKYSRLDILVNNAGIMPGTRRGGDESGANTFDAGVDTIRKAMETNVYGPFQLCQKFVPLMMKNGYGRVVNVSSGMGQLSEMNGGWPAYRISKTSLNAVTRIFASEADEAEAKGVLINSVCPGWVRTDMGGPSADRSPEEGADTIVWAATLPDGGPTGGFFRDREPIAW